MTFKTKKQLEEEIEEKIYKKMKSLRKVYDDFVDVRTIAEKDLEDNVQMKELQATLTQTNEIIKLIENYFNRRKIGEFCIGNKCQIFLKEDIKELLAKLNDKGVKNG